MVPVPSTWDFRQATRSPIYCAALWRSAVALPVYIIQHLLVQVMPSEPHPLLRLLQQSRDPATLILAGRDRRHSGPIVEEFLFRVVLQGALEGVETRAPLTPTKSCNRRRHRQISSKRMNRSTIRGQPPLAVDASIQDIDTADESPAAASDPAAVTTALPRGRVWGLPAGIWPIFISSTLFALMHWRQGPDPIPLFILAIALGYLYRQTHRILPSIVVHMLLNSCSLAAFWLQPSGAPGN